MMRQFLVVTFTLLFLSSFKTDKPAYVLFNSQGKDVQYQQLLKQAKEADVILFGELHDNSIVHWLEQELSIAYDSTLSCYRDIFKQAHGHGGENLPKSQAVKDATMAYFILQNWSAGKTMVH